MIRALRACLRRADLRRVVGVVALLAFVLVVALGAAHLGEGHADADHDAQCGVCSTVALVGTSEAFVAPQVAELVDVAVSVVHAEARVLLACEPARSHASRAPPSLG